MSENNKQDYIKLLDKNSEENIYISFSFHVQLNDTLIMFHTCHLYHNCLQLIEENEMKEEEIQNIMCFEYVLKSVQEALDNRIKCMSSSYIDEAYEWCLNRPEIFDKCLDYFKKIKQEIQDLKNTQELNNILKQIISNDDNINENKRNENSSQSQEDCYC